MRGRSKWLLFSLLGLELLLLAWRVSYVHPLSAPMRADHSHVEFGSAYGEFAVVLITNTDDFVTGPLWHGGPYRETSIFGVAGITNSSFSNPGHYARCSMFHMDWDDALVLYLLPTGLLLLVQWARGFWRRARRRRQPEHCSSCGYDLRASGGRCPECGTPIGGAAGTTGTRGDDERSATRRSQRPA